MNAAGVRAWKGSIQGRQGVSAWPRGQRQSEQTTTGRFGQAIDMVAGRRGSGVSAIEAYRQGAHTKNRADLDEVHTSPLRRRHGHRRDNRLEGDQPCGQPQDVASGSWSEVHAPDCA